jgi:hypothetical protein
MSQGTDLNALQRISSEPHPKFSAEQYCQIMAIALEAPKASGRTISHWTAREIKAEAQKRGIVENIGLTSIREHNYIRHGKTGILGSKASRKTFFSDSSHSAVFHYTPTHSS